MMSERAVMGVIEETYGALAEAIDSSLRHETPDNVRHALQENAFIFSGFKTYHSLREVGLSLTDEKGDIKPFEAFLGDVKRINELYNHSYLYAEYNHAVASALMADKWKQYEADGDKYYLQYRTASDDRVRETHRALHNTTLPIGDEFWDSFLPPNGWNCFVGGTPVLTQNGWRSIESIRRGDLVVGGSGKLKEVIGTHAKLVDEELVCILTKGAPATCTPNHRFCTPHGWVSAENLKPGDIIIQVGEVSAFHLFVHAIANTCTLLRYGLMACIRKREATATLTINNKVERRDKKIDHIYTEKLSHLVGKTYCREMFCGIKDVHAFNGFHSFFDFLRNTFFHNRYVLVEDKTTIKKRETIVYNLSVSNDESYVVPIGITHNCRCTTVQVRKEDYQPSDHDLSMLRGNNVTDGHKRAIFRFNPGKTLRLFPPKHPYFPKNCGECKRNLNLSYDPKREKCQVCGVIQKCKEHFTTLHFEELFSFSNGGKVYVNSAIIRTGDDYDRILSTAVGFAQLGRVVRLLPRFNNPKKCRAYDTVFEDIPDQYYGKCPDLRIDDLFYEHEGYNTKKPIRALKNMLNHGIAQSDRIIIEQPDLPDGYILNQIKGRVAKGCKISEVWIHNEGNVRCIYPTP